MKRLETLDQDAPARPAGWYMRPVRAWKSAFGPLWQPQWPDVDVRPAFDAMAAARRREQQAKHGIGWGAGTVDMTNTPANMRPGWLKKET